MPNTVEDLSGQKYEGALKFQYGGELVYAYHPEQGNIGAPYPWVFYISPRSKIGQSTFVVDANAVFQLQVGHYTGGVTGYWVRYSNMAWQAIPGQAFSFWNQDQQAKGNPEDDEMFYFEVVDHTASTVRIRSRYCSYLRLDGNSFNSGGSQASAAVFTVLFPPFDQQQAKKELEMHLKELKPKKP